MASIAEGFSSADLELLPDIPGVQYEITDGDLIGSSPTGRRFTTKDLKRFPDFPGVRYEIIDGELHVSRQPLLGHQYACGVIGSALHVWNQEAKLGVAVPAPGLIFAPDNNVAPDVIWISRARLIGAQDRYGHIRRRAPELVVEVLSSGAANARRDRERKLALYSRQGVGEYWIIDWQSREG
jgi:Uma2 family endonuclease